MPSTMHLRNLSTRSGFFATVWRKTTTLVYGYSTPSLSNLASPRNPAFRELANFDKLGVEYPYTSVVVLRQTVAKNPDLVERFLKCIVEGIYIFKTNKP